MILDSFTDSFSMIYVNLNMGVFISELAAVSRPRKRRINISCYSQVIISLNIKKENKRSFYLVLVILHGRSFQLNSK